MMRLTKAQRRELKRADRQDVALWLDMATEIQRNMFWKLYQRGYLCICTNFDLSEGYGVIDALDIVFLTDKGRKAVQP